VSQRVSHRFFVTSQAIFFHIFPIEFDFPIDFFHIEVGRDAPPKNGFLSRYLKNGDF
jgi:hypothetical protein